MKALEMDGFYVVEGLLGSEQTGWLIGFVEEFVRTEQHRGGVRNLLDQPEMLDLANSRAVREEVNHVLGSRARVVRGTLFDKTETANWKVPWHQDVTIALRERVEVDGYGPWSVKAGVTHVQPPAEVLERMVSVRLHLDDCPAENGALRVLPGTHRLGKLGERAIQDLAVRGEAVTCAVGPGGALIMRPLLVHASSASSMPGHRRVLHFDYANVGLADGIDWAVGL